MGVLSEVGPSRLIGVPRDCAIIVVRTDPGLLVSWAREQGYREDEQASMILSVHR